MLWSALGISYIIGYEWNINEISGILRRIYFVFITYLIQVGSYKEYISWNRTFETAPAVIIPNLR